MARPLIFTGCYRLQQAITPCKKVSGLAIAELDTKDASGPSGFSSTLLYLLFFRWFNLLEVFQQCYFLKLETARDRNNNISKKYF